MTQKTIITRTPPSGLNLKPQADLIRQQFDIVIHQKGYEVIKESAIKCPCVGRNTNQQSNCKNCGGSGYAFVNSVKTKMILHSMNLNTKFKEWSEENLGTVSISSTADDPLSFMDRITVLDGNAIFSEALFLKHHDPGDVWYFNTIYDIKEIIYIGLFQSVDLVYKELTYGVDYTYEENRILFLTAADYINPLENSDKQDISITIRYKHAPQFYVVDIPRETMQTYNKLGGKQEGPIDLPINAIGRRTHYVLDRQNYDNTRILDNTHDQTRDELNPPKSTC